MGKLALLLLALLLQALRLLALLVALRLVALLLLALLLLALLVAVLLLALHRRCKRGGSVLGGSSFTPFWVISCLFVIFSFYESLMLAFFLLPPLCIFGRALF